MKGTAMNVDLERVKITCERAAGKYRQGDIVSALTMLQGCESDYPEHFDVLYGLGMCHRDLGNVSHAVGYLTRAQTINPTHPGVARALGILFAQVDGVGKNAPGPKQYRDAITERQNGTPVPTVHGQRKPTLAQELDENAPLDANSLPGNRVWRGHRRVASHDSFWLGLIILVALPVLGAAGMVVALVLLGMAAANAALTTYDVFERRVDISHGLLFRKHQKIWLYDVLNVDLVQTPVLLLSHSGSLVLQLDHAPAASRRREKPDKAELRGFGSIVDLKQRQVQLLTMVEIERRAMKKIWV
jgi:hypothetical protein